MIHIDGNTNLAGLILLWTMFCTITGAALSFGWHLFKPKK